MWLWQHKSDRKRHLLLLKLFAASALVHIVILFWLFFVYHDAIYSISISMKNISPMNQVPVHFVYIPEVKKVKQEDILYKTDSQAVKSATKIVAPKRVAKNKKQHEKKKVEQTRQKVQTEKEVEQKSIKKTQPKSEFSQDANKKNHDEPITISTKHKEVVSYRRFVLFQKELVKHWHPPVGTPQDCSCEIAVTIGWDGVIQDVEIIKPSGMLMFDIAARTSLFAMIMPEWVQGRSIVITFEQ